MEFLKYFMVAILGCAVGAAGFWYALRCDAVKCPLVKKYELQTALRKLWADHVIWTRQYIVSTIAKLDDSKAALDRLLKNQEDLGNAIVPFYGADAGKKLAELLTEHIVIAGDVVAAAQANDQEKLKKSDAAWHKNADDIATFLSGANPHWPKAALLEMLNMHLMLLIQELNLRLKKDWVADVANFDKVFEQALAMGDDLANGICKQFGC